MANKVSIGIDAQLDAAGVTQGIDKITQKVNQANKQKIDPVSDGASKKIGWLDDGIDHLTSTIQKANKNRLDPIAPSAVTNATRMFETLKKVNRELDRRANASDQKDVPYENFDFHKAGYSTHRINQIRKYVGDTSGGGGGWKGMAAGAAQAGLRATGSVGGVAAGALGTGMSAGFGAGLMGLMGGMLALGVGKLVSGAMEKVSQAEDNSVALDKLKRVLGDVNVSFEGLKAVVNGGAENLKITYAEAGKLATQFAKLGNLKTDQYTSLNDELGVGVGLSRSFGLDPSEGMGVMGQMRGVGVTRDTQDSKRFALLIGETIAKSDAFAKADEVIGAIGSFATSQTRNNLGAANVSGYAGAFSALVGSGIPGLDPSGAGALLGRINSSLSAGGAKGEASQYFTGMLGAKRGMDVFDTQLWREGGAFSTANSTFRGKGAVSQFYDKFGLAKPSGDESLLSANLGQLKSQYGRDPKMMLNATANQMGLSMSQAAALHLIEPNQMGEMESAVGDLTKLNGGGIGNISKIFSKNPADRRGVADSLLARSDVSSSDKDAIRKSLTESEDTQKQTLARITAQYDQEQTTGKDVRDSKNALDNIKTSLADKLVPYFNEARLGIMHLAGTSKGKTSDQIMREVLDINSKGRRDSIEGQFRPQTQGLISKQADLRMKIEQLSESRLTGSAVYMGKPELVAEKRKERMALEAELLETDKEMKRLNGEKADLLEKENAASKRELDELGKQAANRTMGEIDTGTGSIDASLSAAERKSGLPPGTLRAVIKQETGGDTASYLKDPSKYHYGLNADGKRIAPHTGKVSTAFGPFGILESTAANPGYGVAPLKDKSMEEQTRFAAEYLAARSKKAGGLAGGLSGYGEGAGYSDGVLSKMKKGGTPIPEVTAPGVKDAGTTPDKVASIRVELVHVDKNGREIQPRQLAETRVKSNWAAA